MKTYHEMANDVFRRRDAYEAEQKQKQKTVRASAALFSCFCLIALAGIGIWQSVSRSQIPPTVSDGTDIPGTTEPTHAVQEEKTSDSSGDTNISGETKQANTVHAEEPASSDNQKRIIINEVDSISADRVKMNICLFTEDFVPMSKSELEAYYGTNIFPTVPNDLQEAVGENGYGIYRRNGGTGEVYWDNIIINYTDANFNRSVNIELKKGGLPISDYGALSNDYQKSTINGVEVDIGQDDSGYYLIEFMIQNVGFRMVLEGLSQEEMLTVLASLIP